jgi:hypothetical protein
VEWRQVFYRASASGNSTQLSPLTADGCTRTISRPPYLAVRQITVLTANETPPADFYTNCAVFEVIFRKIS